MSHTLRFVSLGLVILVSIGCSTNFIAKDRYDKDVQTLQDYVGVLEKRNAELESETLALKRVVGEADIVSRENELYAQIAKNIEQWLADSKIQAQDVYFDEASGKWNIAGDILFDSGKFSISKKGKAILTKLAGAYTAKSNTFRVVGHTDRDPIKKSGTKKRLDTDTNLELSARRAVAVAYQLVTSGISERRIFIEGHGNNRPIAPNDRIAANKMKNRRVEIYIVEAMSGK